MNSEIIKTIIKEEIDAILFSDSLSNEEKRSQLGKLLDKRVSSKYINVKSDLLRIHFEHQSKSAKIYAMKMISLEENKKLYELFIKDVSTIAEIKFVKEIWENLYKNSFTSDIEKCKYNPNGSRTRTKLYRCQHFNLDLPVYRWLDSDETMTELAFLQEKVKELDMINKKMILDNDRINKERSRTEELKDRQILEMHKIISKLRSKIKFIWNMWYLFIIASLIAIILVTYSINHFLFINR